MPLAVIATSAPPAAYRQVVSGEKVIDEKGAEQELIELGFSDTTSPYPNAPQGGWSTGVFDCTEHVPSCVTACLCTCVTAGQVRDVRLHVQQSPLDIVGGFIQPLQPTAEKK